MSDFSPKEVAQNILLLLKLDSQRLYDRIKDRSPEYLSIFSIKRTREHFAEIFKSRYGSIEIADLKYCGEDVIRGADAFYHYVDEIKWYLNTTEDMPGTVDDKVHKMIARMKPILRDLQDSIEAEFETLSPTPNESVVPVGVEVSQYEEEFVEGPPLETPELPPVNIKELDDLQVPPSPDDEDSSGHV